MGDLNVASERIDVHPRIKPPEKIYSPEERALLAALLKRWLHVFAREISAVCHCLRIPRS